MLWSRRTEQHQLIKCSFCSTEKYINTTLCQSEVPEALCQVSWSMFKEWEISYLTNFRLERSPVHSNTFQIKREFRQFRMMPEQIQQQLLTQTTPAQISTCFWNHCTSQAFSKNVSRRLGGRKFVSYFARSFQDVLYANCWVILISCLQQFWDCESFWEERDEQDMTGMVTTLFSDFMKPVLPNRP